MKHGRTAHNMSSSSLRKKSDLKLVSKVPCGLLRKLLANLQEVILGTKLSVLFPAIPLAIAAECYGFGRPWVFALSLLGLTPLAERVSFLTEQIAYFTGPTVGGLLNATCGNATELIIAVFALSKGKIDVVKYSLLGSILSNLLLVLGTSLFCGGIANLGREQKYDRRQADVNSLMLLLALLCHLLPMLFHLSGAAAAVSTVDSTLQLSRASSIVMLLAYIAYLLFQLWTHRQLFEAEDSENGDEGSEETVIGFWSGFTWLVGMTVVIALLSEYVVETIEDASDSWGLSVSFLSIILLPIVGNAAEHAGAIIFAFKNKLDITLGVVLGSATQIAMLVVPFCVIVSWIMGNNMDLNFNLLETGSLALAVITTALTLQDGTSHYMKGLVLLLCYIVIGACFFVAKTSLRFHYISWYQRQVRSFTMPPRRRLETHEAQLEEVNRRDEITQLCQQVELLTQQIAALASQQHALMAQPFEDLEDGFEGIFDPIFDESDDEEGGEESNFDLIFDPIYDEYDGEEEDQLSIFLPLTKVIEKKRKNNFLLIQFLNVQYLMKVM